MCRHEESHAVLRLEREVDRDGRGPICERAEGVTHRLDRPGHVNGRLNVRSRQDSDLHGRWDECRVAGIGAGRATHMIPPVDS